MTATAYVDGSFNPDLGKYAFGCVLFHPDGEIEKLCGSGDSEDALLQRNVAGEMIAAMLSVKWALDNGYDSLAIFYDYSGIECWATGSWKAKNDLTRKYASYMRERMGRMKITFTKVAAHTKDKYNDMADELAKEGLTKEPGLPKIVPRTAKQNG